MVINTNIPAQNSARLLTRYGDQLLVLRHKLSAANSQIKDVEVAQESTSPTLMTRPGKRTSE